jgi:hypothetical protein
MASGGSSSFLSLECEGQIFLVDRKLLADSSPVISALSERWQEGDTSEFSLPGSATGLANLLDILRGRPAQLSLDTVAEVLQPANYLGVAAVTRVCQDFLTRSLEPDTVGRIWRQAIDYQLGELEAECKDLVISRFQEVATTGEFLLLDCPGLLAILRDDRLVVSGEEEVWEAALAWLQAGDQGAGVIIFHTNY